ncbi:MAG: DUF1043 family protein [Motiliproteus sp.]
MESASQTVWLVGAATLIIGIVLGLLIARSSSSARSKESLIEELNDAHRELENYKTDVAGHFVQTATLVNKLTDDYRAVHQHLADSASQLCNDDSQLLVSLEHKQVEAEVPAETETPDPVEPPRDYAPKADPAAEGTLSEQYGLQQNEAIHDPSHIPPQDPENPK